MKEEHWKPIDGFTNYEVSDLGRVRNSNTGRIKKNFLNINGYYYAQLFHDGRVHPTLVHRLVAKAFVPNPGCLPEVNHLDEDKTNNAAENLEWCSRGYNMQYSGKLRVGVKKPNQIAVRSIAPNGTVTAYRSLSHAARSLGISPGPIWQVINGNRRTAGGLKWEVAE